MVLEYESAFSSVKMRKKLSFKRVWHTIFV